MLSGGKIIGEGYYGCIFNPPLECKNKKQQELIEKSDESLISKLILKDDAQKEYSIGTVIRQIPLSKNYFIVSESICEPSPTQKDKDIGKCGVIDDTKLSQFRLLMMPYGGIPLSNYSFNIKEFDFMNFVQHFLEAGSLLNLFGIVHRDIHSGNILIDKNNVPRIIDFNLTVRVDDTVTSNKLRHQYEVVISQEPPDSTLVNAILYGYKAQNVIDSIITKKPIIKKITNILQISQYDMRESLESFYNQSKSVKTGNDVTWFKTYWRTIDSWAIGVNLIDLISKLLLWPEFSQSLRRIRPKLFPVLKRLCAVNPIERIDCIQALNYINPNSFIIRKYAKSWLSKVGTGHI